MWMLGGASSLVLTAVVAIFTTRSVHADAPMPKPSAPVASATPALLAPQKPTVAHRTIEGVASWYGGIFNGRPTASGERFNMYAMTACHPNLPFGTVVRVINTGNHRSVVVRITDHSDLLEGRIIDLSYGAAKKLAMTEDGLASVKVEILAMGKMPSNP